MRGTAMMQLVRLLLLAGWLVVAWASYRAVSAMGAGLAGDIFMGDMAHPWRGQFNIDFIWHLLFVGLWLGGTAQRRWTGPLICIGAIVGGGLFSFAYLLVRSFSGDGSLAHLLLGRLYRRQEV